MDTHLIDPVTTLPGRRIVTLSLDEQLVRDTEALGGDLAATFERMMKDFVRRVHHVPMEQADIDAAVAAANAFDERYGLLSDEFPSF